MKLKKRLGIIVVAFIIALVSVCCISLKLNFIGTTVNRGNLQLFFDYGDGYNQNNSIITYWHNGKAEINIGKRYRNCINMRLDPTDAGVSEIDIYKMNITLAGISLYTMDAHDLYDHLYIMNDIENISYQTEYVRFSINGDDPYCGLDKGFLKSFDELTKRILVVKLIIFAVLYIILCILLCFGVKKFSVDRFCFLKQSFQNNKSAIIIALMHWIIALFFQPMFFEFPIINLHSYSDKHFCVIVLYEVLFLLTLILLWHFVLRVIKNYPKKKEAYKEYIKCCLPCAVVLLIILVLIWPGYFCSDEYLMIYRSRYWQFFSIQNYLIALVYLLSFMLIPISSGVQITTIIFISMIVGYIVYKTRIYTNCSKLAYLLYIPFLLPTCLILNLRVLNSIIGGYLELLLIFRIIVLKYEEKELGKKEICFLAALSAVQPVLREDGMFYMFAPFVFWFIFKQKIKKHDRMILIIGTIMLAMVLKIPQTYSLEKEFGLPGRHTIQCFSRLVYGPLKVADPIEDEEELADINQVFSVEKYRSFDSMDESDAAAAATLNPAMTKKDVNNLVIGSAKLIFKYPVVYLKQQCEIFLNTSSIKNNIGNTQASSDMFEHDENYAFFTELQTLDQNTLLFRPFDVELRKKIINGLEGRKLNDWTEVTWIHGVFWNLIPPLISLLMFAIWSIKIYILNRNPLFIGTSALVLARIPILFLTAPYAQFMYWFRFYIMGYLVVAFFVVAKIYKKKKQ